jgi:hypothetical protein
MNWLTGWRGPSSLQHYAWGLPNGLQVQVAIPTVSAGTVVPSTQRGASRPWTCAGGAVASTALNRSRIV